MLPALKLTVGMGVAIVAALPFSMLDLLIDEGRHQGEPQLVTVSPASFQYRAPGEFTRAGRAVNAPLVSVRMAKPVKIMQRQVTAAEYEECVRDNACPPSPQDEAPNAVRPVVKVSWRDAAAYAAWLSQKTGQAYRLPTDQEWAFAAGSRFADEVVAGSDTTDPAKRWLARYEMEASRDTPDKAVRPIGAFGINEHGLTDIAGNVWEWTDTCYRRVSIDEAGVEIGATNVNCGVRVVAGRHRSYMTDFVRDARSGGCAVGIPPTNLGFRLVRG